MRFAEPVTSPAWLMPEAMVWLPPRVPRSVTVWRARSPALEGAGAELSDHHQRPGACHDSREGCAWGLAPRMPSSPQTHSMGSLPRPSSSTTLSSQPPRAYAPRKSVSDRQRTKGSIEKYFPDKGFGFIKAGRFSYFFHVSNFSGTPVLGRDVTFLVVPDGDKQKAIAVQLA